MPNKSLGQHWLFDAASLAAVCNAAHITSDDVILEIGPGLGPLTKLLADQAKQVVAVEFDPQLAKELPQRVLNKNVQVVHADIMHFDLSGLPKGYKVVANVPYYITSAIIRLLTGSPTPPVSMTLLVQKEVAERIAARPGDMSILAVSAQLYANVQLGAVVPANKFDPPPKVDSQIITLTMRAAPLFPDISPKEYMRVVKAGFSEKRKTLRNSLSGGLQLSKENTEAILQAAQVNPGARAESLRLEDWHAIAQQYEAQASSKITPDVM